MNGVDISTRPPTPSSSTIVVPQSRLPLMYLTARQACNINISWVRHHSIGVNSLIALKSWALILKILMSTAASQGTGELGAGVVKGSGIYPKNPAQQELCTPQWTYCKSISMVGNKMAPWILVKWKSLPIQAMYVLEKLLISVFSSIWKSAAFWFTLIEYIKSNYQKLMYIKFVLKQMEIGKVSVCPPLH